MSDPGSAGEEEKRGSRGCLKHVGDWFSYKNKGEWLKEMKGGLSLTASIIATMTFQLATNPPGGVVQANFNETLPTIPCPAKTTCPGYAVMAYVNKSTYKQFLVSNTLSFIASLSVCLLLISGIPLNHRFPTWLLSIGMCIAITSLALTYAFAAFMVTPSTIWDTFDPLLNMGGRVWLSLLGIIVVFLTIRLSIWVVKCCYKCCKCGYKCCKCCCKCSIEHP